MTGNRRGRLFVVALLAGWLALGCGRGDASGEDAAATAAPGPAILDGPHDTAVLELEALGAIRIELLPELAPKAVESFVTLAESGFFDGTTFHRVVPGFMIQGGDPNSRNADPRDDGKGGPGYTLPDEFSDVPHLRGTVSMARRGTPDSSRSQFFIVHQDSHHLDGKYTVFGRVVAGMEVVDAITELEIDTYGRYGPRNRPYPVDARITSVTLEPSS